MVETTTAFKKTVRPGRVTVYGDKAADLFVAIEWDGKRLSISGVEGPRASGDCAGSCGQCTDSLRNLDALYPGWTPNMVRQLAETWDTWHLNDMRPGCQHQRDWDTAAKVTLYTYRLNPEASRTQRALKAALHKRVEQGETVTATPDERELMALPWEVTTDGDAERGPDACHYSLERTETKSTGWVRPNEHPDGLLCKPCPECGYEYGSQWLHEDVPADVIAWLAALPDTDKPNPWGR